MISATTAADRHCRTHSSLLLPLLSFSLFLSHTAPGAVCAAWSKWEGSVADDSGGRVALSLFLYVTFATVFGAMGSWICVVYARQAAGSGIAELKIVLGGFVIKTFLGIRTLVFKTIGLTLAVASGMSLGKEGPMVHIACAWGNILSRPFLKYKSNEVKKREILSASVASGVTAAFGSPLGGVLFALEVVNSYTPPKTMWRSFWCAVCTALVLQYIDPFQVSERLTTAAAAVAAILLVLLLHLRIDSLRLTSSSCCRFFPLLSFSHSHRSLLSFSPPLTQTGKLVQFQISVHTWQWFEIFPFILIGLLGGCLGAAFVRMNVRSTLFRRNTAWLKARPTLEVTIVALFTALVAFPNLFMRGNSGALLANLFTTCKDIHVAEDDDLNMGSASVVAALCEGEQWNQMGWIALACVLRFALTTVTYGSAVSHAYTHTHTHTHACERGECSGNADALQ